MKVAIELVKVAVEVIKAERDLQNTAAELMK
jgi:hypothetical protein